jgi:hypothetical protein
MDCGGEGGGKNEICRANFSDNLLEFIASKYLIEFLKHKILMSVHDQLVRLSTIHISLKKTTN